MERGLEMDVHIRLAWEAILRHHSALSKRRRHILNHVYLSS